MKCAICGREITKEEANNGEPLVHGMVCPSCNRQVITARLMAINAEEATGKNKTKKDD